MEGFDPFQSFDPSVAGHYDDDPRGDEQQSAVLAELADGGPALELAIGTGPIALPLAARGPRRDRLLGASASTGAHEASLHARVVPGGGCKRVRST